MSIQKVAVIGTGVMGQGIARAMAIAGIKTTIFKVTRQEDVFQEVAKFEDRLDKEVNRGKLNSSAQTSILLNLRWLPWNSRAEILSDCDLVVESIVEDFAEKQKLFRQIDGAVKPEVILASNTSTLSIAKLASATGRAKRFLGLHFFNPVDKMRLVEVVQTPSVDADVVNAGKELVQLLDKTPVVSGDTPGFLVNRLLFPYLLDAIRNFEKSLGSIEDMDLAMQLGCNHPMGPFALCDYIGLDVVLKIANIFHEELRDERFEPPFLLKRLVESGMLGLKSEKKLGFYSYGVGPKTQNPELSGFITLDRSSGAW